MKTILTYLFALILIIQAKSQGVDTSYVDEQANLAYELEITNRDSALVIAQNLLEYSKNLGFKKGEALARVRIASISSLNGEIDKVLLEYKRALVLRQEIKDFEGQINVLLALNYAYSEKGLLDSSFSSLFKAERIASKRGLAKKSPALLLEIGNLFRKYGEPEKCIEYIQKAKLLAEQTNDKETLIYIYFALGDYYVFVDSSAIAINFYQTLNDSLLRDNQVQLKAQNLNNIASCYTNLEKYKVAIEYYKLARKQFLELKSSSNLALIYFNLGALYYTIDSYDSSLINLKKSKFISNVIGDVYREMKSEDYLTEVYDIIGNPKEALNHYRIYDSLKTVLLNDEKINSISEMQTKYETEIKEQQIEILDSQNKTKTAQRNFLIAGIIVLLLIGIVVVYHFIQKQKIAKQSQQIAEQKLDTIMDEQEIKTYNAMLNGQEEERMRIANDLHDRLGSMLSTIKLMFGSLEEKIDVVQEENKTQYTKANNLIDEACVEVRRISHNLGAGMIANYGLTHSLEDLCDTVTQTGKVNCRLLTYNMEEGLPLKYEVELYRITQEVINNTIKHAEAKQITIQLNRLDNELSLNIEDDGKGFIVHEKLESEGMGLGSLKKRAEKLNGTLFIDSEPGKGTITIIEIPLV
jgi:signal transduction histidine kinase